MDELAHLSHPFSIQEKGGMKNMLSLVLLGTAHDFVLTRTNYFCLYPSDQNLIIQTHLSGNQTGKVVHSGQPCVPLNISSIIKLEIENGVIWSTPGRLAAQLYINNFFLHFLFPRQYTPLYHTVTASQNLSSVGDNHPPSQIHIWYLFSRHVLWPLII